MKKGSAAGYVEIFCRYIVRNGKVIYPKKAKCFHFWAKVRQKYLTALSTSDFIISDLEKGLHKGQHENK